MSSKRRRPLKNLAQHHQGPLLGRGPPWPGPIVQCSTDQSRRVGTRTGVGFHDSGGLGLIDRLSKPVGRPASMTADSGRRADPAPSPGTDPAVHAGLIGQRNGPGGAAGHEQPANCPRRRIMRAGRHGRVRGRRGAGVTVRLDPPGVSTTTHSARWHGGRDLDPARHRLRLLGAQPGSRPGVGYTSLDPQTVKFLRPVTPHLRAALTCVGQACSRRAAATALAEARLTDAQRARLAAHATSTWHASSTLPPTP